MVRCICFCFANACMKFPILIWMIYRVFLPLESCFSSDRACKVMLVPHEYITTPVWFIYVIFLYLFVWEHTQLTAHMHKSKTSISYIRMDYHFTTIPVGMYGFTGWWKNPNKSKYVLILKTKRKEKRLNIWQWIFLSHYSNNSSIY